MEKIEIGYHPIVSTLGISNHKFIIYTRTDGTSIQIHGGGSNDAGFSPLDEIASSISPSNVEDGGFGFLNVTIFKATNRRKLELIAQRETVFEGQDLSATFFKMAGMAQGIAEQKSPYKFLANNSNTLVDKIVKWSGGNAPSRDDGIIAPGSLPDSEFNPEFFSKLPPPIWGKNLYTRHSDVMSELIEEGAVRNITRSTLNAASAIDDAVDRAKRDRGDLQGIERADKPGDDNFAPGRGDLFDATPEKPAGPGNPNPDQGSLLEVAPDNQTDHAASLAADDDFDMYQMAEEVFSSLTLDDWAIIPDDNDPFDNRHPFKDGVKWVPGLGPPPVIP